MRFQLATLLLLSGCQPPIEHPPGPVPVVVAEFDPRATPPVVPTPNDLAFLGGDGKHLNIMDLPTDSPAQRALNAYLRTLDGFPPETPAAAAFTGGLDPASARAPSDGD